MSFINLKVDTNPFLNFWDLNPHVIYINPYSIIYDKDKSKNKEESSKLMWCITWMTFPDEELNRYYRLPEEERLKTCQNFYPKFNIEDEQTKIALEAFPEHCLSTVERALKGEKEFLTKRSIFLRNADYNYDTMTALDNAASKTSKIIEQFDKIYQMYVESKRKSIQLIGGRQQTAREKNRIKATLADDNGFEDS